MKKPVRKQTDYSGTRGHKPEEHSILHLGPATAVAVLLLTAVLIYANSLPGRFVLDDTVIIQGNASIQSLDFAHLKEIFGGHYWKAVETRGGLYRPVVMLSYALNNSLGGEDPEGYHLANVLLHAVNGVLVFYILEGLFAYRSLSFLCALLFILHPIRTEAVASIVGRAESLSAFFIFLAWWAYLRLRGTGKIRWILLSVAFFILAGLSKESAFCFVALLPLTDFLVGKGTLKERFRYRDTLLRYLPYAAALGLVFALRYWILGGFMPLYINPSSNPLAKTDPWTRFLTATHVFGRYVWLLIVPWKLSPDYSFNQIPLVTSILSWRAWLPLSLLAGACAAAVFFLRRSAPYFFSVAFFFASFLLTSNWVRPIGTIMGERLMYLPALGFNCAIAYILCKGLENARRKTLILGAMIALVGGYALRTFNRNLDWRNHYSLFRSAVLTSPESALVQANLATILLIERKDVRGAIVHARRAAEILPDDPSALYTLGQAYRGVGELASAAQALDSVVRLAPRTLGGVGALRSLGEIHEAMGRYDLAKADYEKLLAWRPTDSNTRAALARVLEKLK